MSFRQGILWSFTAVLAAVYPGVAVAQLAPQSQEEFEQRFTGWTLQFDAPDCNEGDGVDPITFIEPGRFEISGAESLNLEGDYEYEETGANTGTLTVTADILPIPQVLDLTFNAQTMGSFTVAVFGVVVCKDSFEFVESMTVAPPPPTGERIYYFPHLAVGAGWQTTLTYINDSSEEVSCRTDFLSDQGSPLMVSFAGRGTVDSRTDVLPPGGAVHEETDVELSAPLAPGWARASCSGPVKASLLFRRHNSEGVPVAEAGVNAAAVPATRFVTFAEQGEGRLGTGVAYANPSDTAALVTFTARDAAGQMLASVDRNLLPNGHGAHNMAGLFGLGRFAGSLEITSTEPIVALSLNFEADPVFSSLPPGELDAAAQGQTTYYFPHLAVGAGWQTTLTYINDSSEEVSCQTDFLSDQGSPLMVSFAGRGTVDSRTDVLPPGGAVHEETDVEPGAPLVPGWARASCSGPVKASLLFRRFEGGAPTGEAGVNAAAVPATRFVTFAEQGEGRLGTGVAYANLSGTAAHLTFTAKDSAGQALASVDRDLLPNGHGAHNMAGLFGLGRFAGSLEITSTEPIVALSLNFEADPVFSSLPPGETVNPPGTHSGGDPDLAVYSITAFTSPSGTAPGGAFSLAAGVRNIGDGASPATTLRYYRSTDAAITSGDAPVGTDALSALPPSALTEESIRLTAPSSAGTYYYGACVEAVSGESRTANNCSRGRRVTVTAGGGQTPAGWRIDTLAGSRDVRDNGPATAAWLRSPGGVAVDGAGNLFIADTDNHRIRKVDSAGVITTVAGTGTSGFGGDVGDGGPATAARLRSPGGVAVDGAGNLFIADTVNHRIRKVDSAGVISTVAGTGRFGFGGDVGDGGPAIQAAVFYPSGVAVDGAGNLFIAESFYNQIRKVDSAGVITTIAGTGEFFGGFSGDGGPGDRGPAKIPRGRGGGRGWQCLHRRYGQSPDPQGGRRGGHHHRRWHGRVRVQRGRRSSDPGCFGPPLWRGGGRVGQPLHRRYGQSPDPQGRCHGDDHNHRGHGFVRVWRGRRGRRPGGQCSAECPLWRGGGRGWQCLHRRYGQSPDPQGGRRGGHQHRGGCGFVRVWRGRRPGGRGPAKIPLWRGGGRGGQPLHRRYGQSPDPQGGLCGDDHNHRGHGRARGRPYRRGRRAGDRGPAKIPLWRGGGRGGQPLHRRYGQSPDPQGGLCGDDHNHRGCVFFRDWRVRRGRRSSDPGCFGPPLWRGGGRVGQPLHRRYGQRPDPQGGLCGDDHNHRGHGFVRVQWGRRPGDPGCFGPPLWRGGGRGGQPLHRR